MLIISCNIQSIVIYDFKPISEIPLFALANSIWCTVKLVCCGYTLGPSVSLLRGDRGLAIFQSKNTRLPSTGTISETFYCSLLALKVVCDYKERVIIYIHVSCASSKEHFLQLQFPLPSGYYKIPLHLERVFFLFMFPVWFSRGYLLCHRKLLRVCDIRQCWNFGKGL